MTDKKIKTFKDFEGKTIKTINTESVNVLGFTFTDGTTVDVFAECGSANFDIPFFEIYSK